MATAYAEIDLSAIAENVALACRLAGPSVLVMAVVKANAYGHGTVPVAQAALAAGARWLAVARPEEAVPLREAGIACPILVLGPIEPPQAEIVAAHHLDQCVCDAGQAEALDRAGQVRGQPLRLHLKVETGMGRVGVRPREVRSLGERLGGLPFVRLAGLMTHFANAEAEDPAFAREQLTLLAEAGRHLEAAGIRVPLRHAANSAGVLFLPESRLDMVRPGIMLYGCSPRGPDHAAEPALRPALRLRTAIIHLKDVPQGESVGYGRAFVAPRDLRVATLPIGYADGVSRLLSNTGQVLIRGKRAAIVGRVCMDMIMVNVTGVPEVRVGDEAVLIGRQGTEEITADEVAEAQGTISHEVFCRIGPRVARRYLPGTSGDGRARAGDRATDAVSTRAR